MDGKTIHLQEEKARENGEYLEALKLSDEALISYQKEGNIIGLTETLSARFLIFQHLFEETHDKNFLILGKFSAKCAVVIAKKSEKPEVLAIPLYNLAKAYDLLEKYDKAIEKYKEALSALLRGPQSRPSVKADMKIHLAISEFKGGDKSAMERFEDALIDLKNSDEKDNYAKNVWLSGGYMHMAQILIPIDKEKALALLNEASSIVNSDLRLKLRKKQLEKIMSQMH